MDSVLTKDISHNNTAPTKRRLESFTKTKLNILKRAKVTENPDEFNVLTNLFTKPKKIDCNNSTKYSDKKLIRILEDVKLDATGAFQIVSQLKPHQATYVNVIVAGQSQDLKTNNPSEVNKQSTEEIEEIDLTKKVSQETIQETIMLPPTPYLDFTPIKYEQLSTTVIEEIDVTKKISQDLILPPTQFLDLTQSPQEKKVTFNSVVTIEDSPNLVTDYEKPQEDFNVVTDTLINQLNASTASDDSYIKIKDFVFKKHNVNLSPEFSYTKNTVGPMVTDIVTSKFFDEKQEGNNINSAKQQNIDIIEIVDEDNRQPEQVHENPAEKIRQANTTSKKRFEDPECTQKDHAQLAVTSLANYIRDIPCSLNISMDTTGYEDDAEFPQCVDSSLLMSPKADDEMQTKHDEVETQSQEVPSFLSGLRKTGFSMFGNTSENKPEADTQNQNNTNFTFTFGGNEKTKRGGFFSMFQ